MFDNQEKFDGRLSRAGSMTIPLAMRIGRQRSRKHQYIKLEYTHLEMGKVSPIYSTCETNRMAVASSISDLDEDDLHEMTCPSTSPRSSL